MHKILKGRNHTMALFAPPTREISKKIEAIKQQLTELERELQEARGRLATPADALTLLKEIIGSPASSLVLQRKSFRVDWMNVLLDEQNASEGNDISLAEFSVGELQRWAVMVNFRTQEVQAD